MSIQAGTFYLYEEASFQRLSLFSRPCMIRVCLFVVCLKIWVAFFHNISVFCFVFCVASVWADTFLYSFAVDACLRGTFMGVLLGSDPPTSRLPMIPF